MFVSGCKKLEETKHIYLTKGDALKGHIGKLFMNEFNTIILLHGSIFLRKNKCKYFHFGCAIIGDEAWPDKLKRWNQDEEDEARKELAKYKCSYSHHHDGINVEEYALLYCICDDDGDDIQWLEYDLAEDAAEARAKEIVKLLQENNTRKSQLLEELCRLAELGNDWELACDYENDLAEGLANEYDEETCEEVAHRAAEILGVKL